MSKEDEGYRIIDKRFQAASGNGENEDKPESEESPTETTETVSAEQAEEPSVGNMKPETESEQAESTAVADVYGISKWIIGIMAAAAWQYMGLQVNPATGKADKDLVQARIAIDTVVFLGDKISLHLNESELREIRSLINDLQVNFVQQSV